MKPKSRTKKHKKFVEDYDTIKSKHLETLASKMLKKDDKNQQLRSKIIDPKFFNLFKK